MELKIKHRDEVGEVLNDLGLTGEAVEVGAAHGLFASIVLNKWKGRRYHMIDPWVYQAPEVYREDQTDYRGGPMRNYERWYEVCQEMASRDKRIVLHRQYSQEAVAEFADGTLDWVYIDANHAYEFAKADMAAWWPKVKSGGIFSGHDCTTYTTDGQWIEVERAVREWSEQNKIPFLLTPCSSWWVVKP